jgi:hypothetical protein
MEAIVDWLSEGASSAPLDFPFVTDNVPCSVYVPGEHIPPNALFLLSSASFHLWLQVFLQILSIFMELD